MLNSGGERAYVYAKSRGLMGKSFIGNRVRLLSRLTRLSELDRLVFPAAGRELPEQELLPDLERRISARSVKAILKIVSSFSKPPGLLVALIRSYEYAGLKTALSALANGSPEAGPHTDISPYGRIRFGAYPELSAMTGGTVFQWIGALDKSALTGKAGILLQMRLDSQYYEELWKALMATPKKDRGDAEKIIGAEISLRNSVWALRLRVYYEFEEKDIAAGLVHIGPSGAKRDFAAAAEESLSLALASRAAWRKWRWEALLNPEKPGEAWKPDPRYVQNAAAAYLYRMVRLSFRRGLFSVNTSCCCIKLKQIEEDLLTSVAEGLRLGVMPKDVLAMQGVLA
ncbi:MAG: V-type ATPase subunit [Spirochaetaceae bacterium]|jgi:vacuolar-type H+-ATPase subunit C/Vma6|nr:V-type ATPase subunit [Spirochaetaceae bacterium]